MTRSTTHRSFKKKHKFSTFTARDFRDAKKQFAATNSKYKTPCEKGSKKSITNNERYKAWSTVKLNRSSSVSSMSNGPTSDSVKVFVRLRPCENPKMCEQTVVDEEHISLHDSFSDETVPELKEQNITKVNNRSITLGSSSETWKQFTYDNVFDQESRQSDIFEQVGKPVVDAAIKGYNGSVFAYGQTGSGKTYTMLGTPNEPGLIPRVIQHLFSTLAENHNDIAVSPPSPENTTQQTNHVVKVSYLEIYNETILDLLDVESGTKQLRENIKRGVYVDKLVEKVVRTPDEAAAWMEVGNNNRKTASTAMNSKSSRSHAVFALTVEMSMVNKESGVRVTRYSKVNLIDLAGSERQRDTLATGARLKEASRINKSLSALGNVIMSLVDIANTGTSRHVHYRDSKLTFLLRDSLGGNTRTSMIATISPNEKNYAESLSTLKFAQRAKYIRNKVVANEDAAGTADALRKEIKMLKARVEHLTVLGNNTNGNANKDASTCGSCKTNEQTILKLKSLLIKQDKIWNLKIKKMEDQLKMALEQANESEDRLATFTLRHAMSNRRESSIRDTEGRFSPLSNILEEREENELDGKKEKTTRKNSKSSWRQSIECLRRESQGFISNAIEDQSLKLKVQELSEENSRLKCALTAHKDDKETMQDTINELQMKTTSLSSKLKEHLKRQVTPHKQGSQIDSVASTPEKDKLAILRSDYNKVRQDRDVIRNKLSQAERDLSSASSAAITLQKELSTKRKVLREMECSYSELANELSDVQAQLEDKKDQISEMDELRSESIRLKDRIKVLERQSKIKTSSFMNLSTTAGAALNRFGLGVSGFAKSQQQVDSSTTNVVQQGIINTLEKALAKSKQEVKSLKEGDAGRLNDDEELPCTENEESENRPRNMQLGINNMKIKSSRKHSTYNSSTRNSSIGSNASIASVSSVQVYKYESPQKSQLTDTSGTRFSVAKYFPGGDKFASVKHRSTSVVSNDSSFGFDKTSSPFED